MSVRSIHNPRRYRSAGLIVAGLLPFLVTPSTTSSAHNIEGLIYQDMPSSSTGPRVAAIVYSGLHPERVSPNCTLDDTCAIETLIRRADSRGAILVVAPEYGLDQSDPETDTTIGTLANDIPNSASLTRRFARLADELNIYLVINLETRDGDKDFNTQLAFDPHGTLIAKHHKFELYSGERDTMTAGKSVSTFDTPFGRIGLLICADIYGNPEMHRRLIRQQGAQIIAFSAQWTVKGAPRWQAAFAHDWGVYFVGSNGSSGIGQGGGIFDPKGQRITDEATDEDYLHLSTLPPLQ